MKLKNLVSQTIVATAVLASATALNAQTLQQAITAAQNHVPALAAQQATAKAAAEQVGVAKSSRKPQVRFTANGTFAEYDNNSTRVNGGDGYDSNSSQRFDIVATQRLFDFGDTSSQVSAAKHLYTASEHEVNAVREDVVLSVVNAYVNVLRFSKLDDIAAQNVRTGQDLAGIIDKQVEKGRSADVEQSLAQSQLAVTQAQHRRQGGLLAEAKTQFTQLTGLQPDNLSELPALQGAESFMTDRSIENINANLGTAPSVQIANSEREAATEFRDASKAKNLPTVDLELFAGQGEDEDAVLGKNDSYGARVNLNWDLYAGGGNRAQQRAAAAEEVAAQNNVYEQYRQARQNVLTAVDKLTATKLELIYLDAEASANVNVYKAYQQQLMSGRRSPLDVFVVLNNYNQSRLKLVDTQYRKRFEEYSVLAAYGKLAEQFGL